MSPFNLYFLLALRCFVSVTHLSGYLTISSLSLFLVLGFEFRTTGEYFPFETGAHKTAQAGLELTLCSPSKP